MIESIIQYSVRNKLIIILFAAAILGGGIFSLTQINLGAVPDITTNQVQIITVSRNLATEDVEQFITYPIEIEMSNLPGVSEIRSISKFGLSVVTVVFDDALGAYLPRQLINEKIKAAEENIPAGFGKPMMGPITTGLGEIYQYTIDAKPGYEDQYTTMDIRTIHDWIVRRQMSGIPGVVEVNTWGGLLKQYQVTIDPQQLNAMDITIAEVFAALEQNNDVSGGAYIEKNFDSYFIRGEGMVKTLEDIRNIVVTRRNGNPVFVYQVGEVNIGSAVRFGAITANGKGETVLGQVMMLKGANSSKVIADVKDRIERVQTALPEGLEITPIVDRTELIGRTTFTIAENLILGALIVIFVVVLLLGNIRSGLIVASVIPLSLMFGITLMHIFKVDANLMSLGAIDFGIIIDGAVIIVEFILFEITRRYNKGLLSGQNQSDKDAITVSSASKMMKSAIFGQVIILIVFIPILSLSGIEGKMFRPMAMAFSFVLLGAMILCLTYIPVMASLFIKPEQEKEKPNLSQRLMSGIDKLYTPTIKFALDHVRIILITATLLFGVAVALFLRMGGEFVPTLDEGDYVVQPILRPGTSLSKTVEINTQIENILIDQFPEVERVVSRIGAAEIPTDPMSMEMSDIIIKLRPKSEWVSAETKDELADKMKAAMSVIPGIVFEFTQPIEMRFNELISGVRSDLAIKIFGEDINMLSEKAAELRALIVNVEGASDISVEQTTGLPQISVNYNRAKIAQHGVTIKEVNDVIQTAFAGKTAGVVFEGERRFDLAVRLKEGFRQNTNTIQGLYIQTPAGKSIPLTELADINYTYGPAQISREDAKRRIVIGVNVRNRDVESVVQDIQQIVNNNLDLPPGYVVTYGGQFENLRQAKERLSYAVPVSLLLIFIMLHFTFKSVKQALMVYTAIPLAAIGGVLFLWLRDLPFSISAGVGFIALFGIAVLNGIVLIDFFNELEEEGVSDIKERIITGTRQRLRPVLLTALSALMGFTPMALSSSAGAEVQRPLATVVIGGLVTATFLTLVVLPVIYMLFTESNIKIGKKAVASIALLCCVGGTAFAQEQVVINNMDEAVEMALTHNRSLKAGALLVEQQRALEKSSFDLGTTQIYYGLDEANIAPNDRSLPVLGFSQDFNLPGTYTATDKMMEQQVRKAQASLEQQTRQVKLQVTQAYQTVVYYQAQLNLLSNLDSLYRRFQWAASRRFEVGETNIIEKLTAEAKSKSIGLQLIQAEKALDKSIQNLMLAIQVEAPLVVSEDQISSLETVLLADGWQQSSEASFLEADRRESDFRRRLEASRFLPSLSVEYFMNFGRGENAQNFPGYQVGLNVPLWVKPYSKRYQAAQIAAQISEVQYQRQSITYEKSYQKKLVALEEQRAALAYYEGEGLALSSKLQSASEKAFAEGSITYLEYVQGIDQYSQLQLDYLNALHQYNLSILELQYFTIPL